MIGFGEELFRGSPWPPFGNANRCADGAAAIEHGVQQLLPVLFNGSAQ